MDDKNTFWPIVYGGLEWFNTRGMVEVFLDNTRRIQIVYQDILTEEEFRETIEIYGLPARPPKTTKISIEVEYYGAERGAIVIRDMGFGTLFPTTNKIYRKEFDIASLRKKQAKKLENERVKAAEGDTEELIGDDPVDRDDIRENERREMDRIQAEETAAQDALKHEIHMDLDDLRYRAEDDDSEDVVYYGTASPVQDGVGDQEDDIEDVENSTDDNGFADEDFSTVEEDAEQAENQTDDNDGVDVENQDDDNGVADADEAEIPIEDINAEESENLTTENDAADGDMAAKDDNVTVDDISYDDDPGDDEQEQSSFTIPAYLRGQHFDPGE